MDEHGSSLVLRYSQLSEVEDDSRKNLATIRPKYNWYPANDDLDVDTKRAALKVSSSVVSLESYSDEEVLSQGCGTIIEVDETNTFVLTSASLVRRPTETDLAENTLADKLKLLDHFLS